MSRETRKASPPEATGCEKVCSRALEGHAQQGGPWTLAARVNIASVPCGVSVSASAFFES